MSKHEKVTEQQRFNFKENKRNLYLTLNEEDLKDKENHPRENEKELYFYLLSELLNILEYNIANYDYGNGEIEIHLNFDSDTEVKDIFNVLKKIKNYILSQNCLEDKTIEEHLNYLSNLLDITPNLCRTLYNEIPLIELLNRQININTYLNNLNQLSKKCNECNKKLLSIQINTNRIWNGNEVCDYCWSKYDEYRKLIWQQISEYKIVKCEICNRIKQNDSERYHYDHLNMFNKNKSICTMVNEGMNIEQIYSEIDKCQILCLSCHHIVTDIEHKLDFTRMKQTLTRNFNQGEITEEKYIEQTLIYQNIYEEKMKDVYEKLKNHLQLFEIG